MTVHPITIDLNADVGEGFGPYAIGADEAIIPAVSSANVACGFHAGDPHIMRKTVELCLAHGTAIGAHPGLPDRMGFGRRAWQVSPEELYDWMLYQIGALQTIAAASGGIVRHVKPHGALYHMASEDAALAEALVRSVRAADGELMLFGPPNSELERAAKRQAIKFVAEGFADRSYAADGRLLSRILAGAVIERPEQALAQAMSLAREGGIRSRDGTWVELAVGTLCMHSDTSQAAALAKSLSEGMRAAGVIVSAPEQLPKNAVDR